MDTDPYTRVQRYIGEEKSRRTGHLTLFAAEITQIPLEVLEIPWITSINLNETSVDKLGIITDLENLKVLSMSYTRISDISGIENLGELTDLVCSGLNIHSGWDEIFKLEKLESVICDSAADSRFGPVPVEILSQGNENCLPRLKDYYESIKGGASKIKRVKLFIYGNGEVGKTQLLRQLNPPADAPSYDVRIPSTHGVQIQNFRISGDHPDRGEHSDLYLRAWDFGGQDLYHGTHSLFLKDKAVHLIAWTPERESGVSTDPYGYQTNNHPIQYWVSFAKLQEGNASGMVLVQTQTDNVEYSKDWDENELNELRTGYGGFFSTCATSSKENVGIEELRNLVYDAADWVLRSQNWELISTQWLEVENVIQSIQDENAKIVAERRSRRVISFDEFREICQSCGVDTGFDTLVHFLSATGLVFWDKNLFSSKIILDQQWALDAIYSVFDRSKCISKLRSAHGRFLKSDLSEWIWNEQRYSQEEQSLFIDFMQSCRICFPYRTVGGETVYIATSALPPRSAVKDVLGLSWSDDWETIHATFNYDLLHDGLLRSMMYEVGNRGGTSVTFWDEGMQFYEHRTRSRARIVQRRSVGSWAGSIEVSVQTNPAYIKRRTLASGTVEEDDPATTLAKWVSSLMEKQEVLYAIRRRRDSGFFGKSQQSPAGKPVELKLRNDPDDEPGFFISYAWGDKTEEGIHRAEIVEQFCVEAARRKIAVNIDRDALRPGASIAAYMDRLSRGSRVFVFLSHRYLESKNCMSELISAWNYSHNSWEEFQSRVKIFILPCARIFQSEDRMKIKSFWQLKWLEVKEGHEKIDPLIMSKSGSPEREEVDSIGSIYYNAYPLLTLIASHLPEANFQGFCDNWLDELI